MFIPNRSLVSRDGAVVRALASHQCVSGSIPALGIICGLSLLLVLYFALRGLSPGTLVFLCPHKHKFNPAMHGHFWTISCELLGAPWENKLHTLHHFISLHITKLHITYTYLEFFHILHVGLVWSSRNTIRKIRQAWYGDETYQGTITVGIYPNQIWLSNKLLS